MLTKQTQHLIYLLNEFFLCLYKEEERYRLIIFMKYLKSQSLFIRIVTFQSNRAHWICQMNNLSWEEKDDDDDDDYETSRIAIRKKRVLASVKVKLKKMWI
jgi:hypothetical protein